MYHEDEEISYMIPTPKSGQPRDLSLTPISIMVIDTIGTIKSRKLLKVLFDPGSTKTLISSSVIPRKAAPHTICSEKKVNTIAGTMTATKMVHLRNLKLPEFDKNRIISEQKALIFDNKCPYAIILGSDFLTRIGLDIKYSTGEMEWYDNTLPMRELWKIDNKEFLTMADSHAVQIEDKETFGPG